MAAGNDQSPQLGDPLPATAGADPQKAYKNDAWLNSSEAKPVRIMCEFFEPESRMTAHGVKDTILVFGSARAKSPEAHAEALEAARAAAAGEGEEAAAAAVQVARLERTAWMSEWYLKTAALTKRLSEWSLARCDPAAPADSPYTIITGGGPGMMEAANRGAHAAGARSVGMGIALPFENRMNPYITDGLAFKFHYFSSRKFQLVYRSNAVICAPGGVGTFDELFEVLTLLQTGRIGGSKRRWKSMTPIVLLCKDFWKGVINLEEACKWGTISEADVQRLHFSDTVEDAFEYVTERLLAMEQARSEQEEGFVPPPPPSAAAGSVVAEA